MDIFSGGEGRETDMDDMDEMDYMDAMDAKTTAPYSRLICRAKAEPIRANSWKVL